MSSGDKSKTSSQTDGKAAQGKKSEMGMMSYKVGDSYLNHAKIYLIYHIRDTCCCCTDSPVRICPLQMYVFDQENFQGRMIEISNECMNVCEMGMDRVRSLRVECGP